MMWRILASARNRAIEKNLRNVGDAQRTLLKKILRQLESCKIARDLGINRGTSIDVFRKSVSVTDYDFYKPYIRQILNGRMSVLFPGHPACIAQTGGSTTDPKLIPLGKDLIRSYRQFNLDMAFCYMQDSGHYNILSDRIFLVVASPDMERLDETIPIGRATGVMARIAPTLVRRRYVPDMDVILETDTLRKIEQTTKQAFRYRHHVHMAAGLTPYLMAAFNHLIHHARESDRTVNTVGDVFPQLQVAFHGGTTFDLYSATIRRLTGEGVTHRNIYSAAEGPIAFQFSGASLGLLPALDAVFFEFLSVDRKAESRSDTILLDQIECGVPYYILLTTQGGLLRYKIGDQVEFVEKNPPLLRVLGRVEDQVDLSGEKMSVTEAMDAIKQAADSLGLGITDFLVCPAAECNAGAGASHEWIIECEKPPADLITFRKELESALFAHNHRYQQLRDHEFALHPPKIRFVGDGTFQRYLENELVYGQQKMFHMHNDRSCADRLLRYAC